MHTFLLINIVIVIYCEKVEQFNLKFNLNFKKVRFLINRELRDDTRKNEQFHINEAESDDESDASSVVTNFSLVAENDSNKTTKSYNFNLNTVSKATGSNFQIVPLTSQL